MTVCAVYLPLAAVQVPMSTLADAPAASVPLYEPVRVLTVLPFESSTVSVMPCAPEAVAIVP